MLATAYLLLSLATPSALANTLPATAVSIDQTYTACVKAAGDDESTRAECLNAALPQAERALAAIVTALLGVLEANPTNAVTLGLVKEAHQNFPPSRDADCRLRGQVVSGEDPVAAREVTRECIYQADRTRLQQFEMFLGYLKSEAD